MPTWTVKVDRRKAEPAKLVERLQSLEQSVQGLRVQLVDRHLYEGEKDRGDFRDFAPVARLSHERREALRIVTEELILEFGWLIDLSATEL